MCGIAGILEVAPRQPDVAALGRMLDLLRHRGPDETGLHVDRELALAHARLSILDLAGGHQPMHTADRRLSIVFNGEIFNYVELRAELMQGGARFATASDTEVILHAYREHGPACVESFNGQWAFAIWDAERHELFLSRDRMGILPLFYTLVDGALLFASEIKALLAHPAVARRLDLRGLDQLFTFWHTIGDRTLFEGIRELPPGCNLISRGGALRPWRYWTIPFGQPAQAHPDVDHLAGELRDLLTDATRIRLRADVPVGAYLSGGLDSSVTTALMQRTYSGPMRTFSVEFDDAEFDESAYQADVVAYLKTDHHGVRCPNARIGAVFPDVVWHAEKAMLRTAPAPLFELSRLVRDSGYKVVLTGEGADEFLGGYDIFKEAKVRRFCAARPESTRRLLLLRKLYPYLPQLRAQPNAYLQSFFRARPEDTASPFFSHAPRWEMTRGLKTLFSSDVRAALEGYDAVADFAELLPEDYPRWLPFEQAQYLEATGLMPGYILSSQGDRMLMSHSVEGRFPFLDHRVAAFAARLPPRLKMRALCEKYLLKRAAADLVPVSILQRHKQPYRAPDGVSFLGPPADDPTRAYVRELLSPEQVARAGIFDVAAVTRLFRKAEQGQTPGLRDNMALVGLISTQLLFAQFIERLGRLWHGGSH